MDHLKYTPLPSPLLLLFSSLIPIPVPPLPFDHSLTILTLNVNGLSDLKIDLFGSSLFKPPHIHSCSGSIRCSTPQVRISVADSWPGWLPYSVSLHCMLMTSPPRVIRPCPSKPKQTSFQRSQFQSSTPSVLLSGVDSGPPRYAPLSLFSQSTFLHKVQQYHQTPFLRVKMVLT